MKVDNSQTINLVILQRKLFWLFVSYFWFCC